MLQNFASSKGWSGRTAICRTAALACLLGLTGCADGIEFQGKIFEAVGLTGSLGPKAEPRTEARSPLVLPPSGQALPPPGEVAAAAAPQPDVDNPQWPKDPDQEKAAGKSAADKAQQAYCKDGNWQKKAMGDEIGAAQGPTGSCNGNIFSVMSKGLFGE